MVTSQRSPRKFSCHWMSGRSRLRKSSPELLVSALTTQNHFPRSTSEAIRFYHCLRCVHMLAVCSQNDARRSSYSSTYLWRQPVVQWVRAGAFWPSELIADDRGFGFGYFFTFYGYIYISIFGLGVGVFQRIEWMNEWMNEKQYMAHSKKIHTKNACSQCHGWSWLV